MLPSNKKNRLFQPEYQYMAPDTHQINALLMVLKSHLKLHGITYEQVARHLSLSETSVKRLFSTGHMPLERLIHICQLVGLSLHDLVQLSDLKERTVEQLPYQSELTLIKDVKLMLVSVCVFSYWSFDDILTCYQLNEAELVSCLLQLERMNIITLKPNNQYQLHTAPNFSWIQDGPIELFFKQKIQKEFLQHDFTSDSSHLRLLYGMLSESSNQQFQKALEDLEVLFKKLCEQDKHLPINKKFGTVHLMALRPWELQEFSALKRPDYSD